MKNKKRNRDGFFKDTLIEFIFEVVWNILMFIPRMIIRLIGLIGLIMIMQLEILMKTM